MSDSKDAAEIEAKKLAAARVASGGLYMARQVAFRGGVYLKPGDLYHCAPGEAPGSALEFVRKLTANEGAALQIEKDVKLAQEKLLAIEVASKAPEATEAVEEAAAETMRRRSKGG